MYFKTWDFSVVFGYNFVQAKGFPLALSTPDFYVEDSKVEFDIKNSI